MQVYGMTGYLGEYELSSIVSEQVANGIKEYSGPLAVKHVGLCTRDGPQETTGQIRIPANRVLNPRHCNAGVRRSRVYLGRGSLGVVSWLHELRR